MGNWTAAETDYQSAIELLSPLVYDHGMQSLMPLLSLDQAETALTTCDEAIQILHTLVYDEDYSEYKGDIATFHLVKANVLIQLKQIDTARAIMLDASGTLEEAVELTGRIDLRNALNKLREYELLRD